MGHDPFNPLSSARVNVLVVPAGQIRASRYAELLNRLRLANHLSVSTALPQQDEVTANEGSFPHLLLDFASAPTEALTVKAYPFQLNRVPQVLLAIADGEELHGIHGEERLDFPRLDTLVSSFDQHRRQYPDTWVEVLIIFDDEHEFREREDVFSISRAEAGDVRSVQSLLSQVTQLFKHKAEEVAAHVHEAPISFPLLLSSGTRSLTDRRKSRIDRKHDGLQPGSGVDSWPATPSQDSGSPAPQTNSAAFSRNESLANSPPVPEASDSIQKGRSLVVRGNLYMQIGEWQKASNELIIGAVHAQTCQDHIWNAKAIEELFVCSLLLSQVAPAFQVPQVLQATDGNQLQLPPKPASSHNGESSLQHSTPMQALIRLAPAVMTRIMSLSVRGNHLSSNEGSMPPLMICECKIRLTNLVCGLNVFEHSQKQGAIDALILNLSAMNPSSSLLRFQFPDAASSLLQTVTDYQSLLNPKEFIQILIGLSSTLGNLRFTRKQAFYLYQLFQRLAPILIEARKIGAAEIGLHPAAGLSVLGELGENRSINPGEALIGLFDTAVQSLSPVPPTASTESQGKLDAAKNRISALAMDVASGDKTLRMELLRTCINICDALPDPVASLRYTTKLLETSRIVITVSAHFKDEVSLLPSEEQQRLLGSIKRTVAAAKKLGRQHVQAYYWDDLLVRSVFLGDVQGVAKLSSRTVELAMATGDGVKSKDPFIVNSFSKAQAAARSGNMMVAGEAADFRVTLQNAFEFEVEVDAISLLTEGCAFNPHSHSIVLGPLCVQDFVLSGIPQQSGQLKVVGCRVKVKDCYEQDYFIFGKDIQPIISVKLRSRPRTRRKFAGEAETTLPAARADIEAESLLLSVINPQPYLSISSTSPAHSSLMMLEGEIQTFEITFHNQSETMTTDFLLFTFEDSVTKHLQNALDNKELSSTELYEISHQLANLSIQSKEQGTERETQIGPGQRQSFPFKVYAKPGLTNAVVQIDYAHLGRPPGDIKGECITRQLRHSMTLTVNGSVDVPRFNIQPLSDNFLQLNQGHATTSEHAKPGVFPSLSTLQSQQHGEGYCLLLIDLRNVWPYTLEATIKVTNTASPETSQEQPPSDIEALHETLQPGHTSRVVVAMPRIFLSDPHAPIPIIGTQRQFVVNTSTTSPEAELAAREAFWCKEALLKQLHGMWTEPGTCRSGSINFRKAIRLNPRMIEALLNEQVDISFSLQASSPETSSTSIQQVAKSHFSLATETFATLIVRIRNRSNNALRLLVRLQPSLRNQPHNIALDLSKKFLWSGVLQRPLHPPLEPGETRETSLGIVVLVKGEFEVSASVEEIVAAGRDRRGRQANREPPPPPGTSSNNTARSTNSPNEERRIWHARDPCLIDAVTSVISTALDE